MLVLVLVLVLGLVFVLEDAALEEVALEEADVLAEADELEEPIGDDAEGNVSTCVGVGGAGCAPPHATNKNV